MKAVAPIFRRELIAGPQRKRFYLKRLGLLGLGVLVVLWGFMMSGMGGGSTMGLMMFIYLSFATLVGVGVMAAGNASFLVMREKDERTLGLLFLTDMTPREFLAGKLLTSLFYIMLAALSFLPLFMLVITLGGVMAGQVLLAYGIILSNAFMLASLGIMAAVVCDSDRSMYSAMGLSMLGYYAWLPLSFTLMRVWSQNWNGGPEAWEMCCMSPFVAMGYLYSGQYLLWSLVNCAVNLLIGATLLWLAGAVLPHKILTKDRPAASDRFRARVRRSIGLRRLFGLPPLRGNPVFWRELNFSHMGAKASWLYMVVGLVLLFVIALGFYLKVERRSSWDMSEFMEGFTYIVFWLSFVGSGLSTIAMFGGAFSRDKRGRTLEVLLTTDLSEGEIVFGKVRAILLLMAPWYLCTTVSGVFAMTFIHSSDKYEMAAFFVPEYVAMVFGYSAMALFLSLALRKNVGAPAAIAVLILYNTVGRFFMIPLSMLGFDMFRGGPWMVGAIDVFIHGMMGVVFVALLTTAFRAAALREPT